MGKKLIKLFVLIFVVTLVYSSYNLGMLVGTMKGLHSQLEDKGICELIEKDYFEGRCIIGEKRSGHPVKVDCSWGKFLVFTSQKGYNDPLILALDCKVVK